MFLGVSMRGCAHVHVQEPEEARGSDLLELEVQVLVRAGCGAGNQTSALCKTDKCCRATSITQTKTNEQRKEFLLFSTEVCPKLSLPLPVFVSADISVACHVAQSWYSLKTDAKYRAGC